MGSGRWRFTCPFGWSYRKNRSLKTGSRPDFWLFYWQLDFILKVWYYEQQITQGGSKGRIQVRKEPPTSDTKQLRQPLGSHSSLSAHRQGFGLFVWIEGIAIKAKSLSMASMQYLLPGGKRMQLDLITEGSSSCEFSSAGGWWWLTLMNS